MLHTHSPKLTDAPAAALTSEARRIGRKLGSLDLPKAGQPVRAMDVCLVTSEIDGPASAGGIGTASVALARQLVADGHRVTMLYTQVWNSKPYANNVPWEDWVEQFRRQGLTLAFIPHSGDYADWQAKAWLVMEFLKRNTFDLVYFNEHHGSGYYAISAKRARIAPFVNQTYGVIAHGSLEWVLQHNEQYMLQRSDLLLAGMERRCVEWADFVLSPSEYLLQEYASYGWQLPERSFVHPYPLLRKAAPPATESVPVDELVFFGRLEARKGLWLFCEAIERMAEELRGKTVTFMGRIPDTAGVSVGSLLVARAAKWPFAVRFATWFSTQEALQYLQRPGKLAVMPSLADNSPCVVYECLERGIPFLTTLGSGAQELVTAADQAECLVSPAVTPLTAKLQDALQRGVRPARPSFKPEESLRTWKSWHGWLAAQPAVEAAAPAVAQDATDTVVLNLMIDSGECELETLLDNLQQQSSALGGTAGHLVLTSRGQAFQRHLTLLLQDLLPSESSVLVLGVDEAQQARDIILDADLVFFSGAEYHVDLSFYLRSVALIRSGAAAAVSCMAAHSDGNEGALQIATSELPCGDLPGAAAMQAQLGAPVLAISVALLKAELESLPIHDATFDQWVSAGTLGQRLLQRCQLSQQPYLLLPLVAAKRIGARRHEPAHWYRDLAALAEDLGVRTLIHPDAAPWLAMSSQGDPNLQYGRQSAAEQRLDRFGAAPDRSRDLPQRLRLLSRKIGRPFLAAQLGYAFGEQAGLPEDILPSSCENSERRRVMDPLWNLTHPAEGQALAGLIRGVPGVLVSPGLSLAAMGGRLQCTLAANRAGTLTVIDLPLQRHERLTLQVSGFAGAEIDITMIDQQSGEVMLQRPLRLKDAKPAELSLRLPRILGTAMIVLRLKATVPGTLSLREMHIV